MGIGNSAKRRGFLQLITPHGDREPTELLVRGLRTDSLPLMGIGNPLGRRSPCVAIRDKCSLPLMGIGNFASSSDAQDADGLARYSLPLMGIGNTSDLRKRGAPGATSHYPSWGSGTSLKLDLDRDYPSWGSGTKLPDAPRSTVFPPNSLPLMGIGNPPLYGHSYPEEGTKRPAKLAVGGVTCA